MSVTVEQNAPLIANKKIVTKSSDSCLPKLYRKVSPSILLAKSSSKSHRYGTRVVSQIDTRSLPHQKVAPSQKGTRDTLRTREE